MPDDFRPGCGRLQERSNHILRRQGGDRPIVAFVGCLQVDAISLQFRIQLTAAQFRDKTDKQNQPVSHLRMAENKIANLCSKNVYWLSLFYMQYACVHADRSKIPSLMLESLRHLQDLTGKGAGDGKSMEAESSAGPAFVKGDEIVLPPPEVVMITSNKAVVTSSKPAKGPPVLKAIKYFSIDAKASSGTSVRALGQRKNHLIPIGDLFTVKGLQCNLNYVFIASYYDSDGKSGDQHAHTSSVHATLVTRAAVVLRGNHLRQTGERLSLPMQAPFAFFCGEHSEGLLF